MHLEEHGLRPGQALPVLALPGKAMVDHLTRSVHVVGLEMRCRIGDFDLAVDLEAVARARAGVLHMRLEPSVAFRHRDRRVENDADLARSGRPEAKGDASIGDQRTKAGLSAHGLPANAKTDFACAPQLAPGASAGAVSYTHLTLPTILRV